MGHLGALIQMFLQKEKTSERETFFLRAKFMFLIKPVSCLIFLLASKVKPCTAKFGDAPVERFSDA